MGNQITWPRKSKKSSPSTSLSLTGSGSHRRSNKDKHTYCGSRTIDGREYYDTPVNYPFPMDQVEMDRLDAVHYSLQEITGRNYFAPLHQPRRVLDVGTGSGVWLLEMAAAFPDTEFIGIDIAAMQPSVVVPPNVKFMQANVVEGLPFEDDYFDFVYMRMVGCALTPKLWRRVTRELARVCASGGAVEICETDGLCRNSGPCARQLASWYNAYFASNGIDMQLVWKVPDLLEACGLAVEVSVLYPYRIGDWAGVRGRQAWRNVASLAEALRPCARAATDNPTDVEFDALLERLQQEVNERSIYWQIGSFVARKP